MVERIFAAHVGGIPPTWQIVCAEACRIAEILHRNICCRTIRYLNLAKISVATSRECKAVCSTALCNNSIYVTACTCTAYRSTRTKDYITVYYAVGEGCCAVDCEGFVFGDVDVKAVKHCKVVASRVFIYMRKRNNSTSCFLDDIHIV